MHIHDNYIHHNQAVGGDGYGVTVGSGGYALIERNVFDWNRHAIEGDGKPGHRLRGDGNLVLEHGGLHRWIPCPGFWVHTHQFDMHGAEDCGIWDIFSDCARQLRRRRLSMFIRHNTFFYAHDHAIKLRGTPEEGMFVGQNVFANHLRFSDAATQEETGLVEEPATYTATTAARARQLRPRRRRRRRQLHGHRRHVVVLERRHDAVDVSAHGDGATARGGAGLLRRRRPL